MAPGNATCPNVAGCARLGFGYICYIASMDSVSIPSKAHVRASELDWKRFGSTIHRVRLSSGLTQSTITQRGGPSDTTLSKIETGTWRPRRAVEATLSKLDAGFGWEPGTASKLLSGDDDLPGADLGDDLPVDALAVLIGNYRQLEDLETSPGVLHSLAEQLVPYLRTHLVSAIRAAPIEDLLAAAQLLLPVTAEDLIGSESADDPEPTQLTHRPRQRKDPPMVIVAGGRRISLREYRESKGLRLSEVAADVTSRRQRHHPEAKELSRGTLSGVELGYRGMGADIAQGIAEALELRIVDDHLFATPDAPA